MSPNSVLRGAAAVAAMLAALVLSASATPHTSPPVKVTHLTIVGSSGQQATVAAEVADTTEKMLRGLMFRRYLPPDRGMLFDFGTTVQAPFYMKNTYIPLSIAFISPEGYIVDILDMEPLDERSRAPSHPYRYALEVNRGFFLRHDLKVEDRVSFGLAQCPHTP